MKQLVVMSVCDRRVVRSVNVLCEEVGVDDHVTVMCVFSRLPNPKQHQDLRRRTTQSELQKHYLKPRRLSTACSKRRSPGN